MLVYWTGDSGDSRDFGDSGEVLADESLEEGEVVCSTHVRLGLVLDNGWAVTTLFGVYLTIGSHCVNIQNPALTILC